jgi:hypothetical protein
LRTVLIVEASHLLEARLRADIETPGLDDHFIEGHELGAELAERIPAGAIGRMMTAADATRLVERLDPIPKRPPAPSSGRMGFRRSRRIT